MGKHVIEEAKKCLQCKNPSCKKGCPVSTPINEVVGLLLDGKIEDAGKKLFENNPLSVVCAFVCPHETQCEGNCVLSRKGAPVQISSIESYISDYYLNMIDTKPVIDPKKKIAIIGSGPAGISIAIILAKKGYDITIFEAHDKIGGVLRYGIPEFRLPNTILDRYRDILIKMGIKIRPNTLIGPVITIDNLFRDGYKAIFLGTGVWKPKKMDLKGESLGHVHYAIDYLKNPDVYELGDRVSIIGAGNTAMDVARTAIRNGSRNVSIIYRRGPEDVPAREYEVEYAKLDGVQFEFYKEPIEITDTGVVCANTKVEVDDEGNSKLIITDSTEEIKGDSVIIAISQGPLSNIVSNTKGIETSNKGLVTIDDLGRTTRPGVFASGDVVTGAKTVVEAVRLSKLVANAIEEYVEAKVLAE